MLDDQVGWDEGETDGQRPVRAEALFYSPLVDPSNQTAMNNMFGLIKLAVETAALDAAQFTNDVGGRGLEQ